MSTSDLVVVATTAGVPILGAVAQAVRYLVRILRSIENVTRIAEQVAGQFTEHVATSDAAHAALTTQVGRHETAIAVLRAHLTPGSPPQ